MSILSFIKKDKEELVILLDIGSGLVTSSLLVFYPKQIPKIIYLKKSFFSIKEDAGTDLLLQKMEKGLNTALEDTVKHGIKISKNKKIDKVLITFSSPWFFTLSKSIKVEKDEPFYITTKTIKDISDKEAQNFKAQTIETLPKNINDSLIVLESSVVNTRLNGYSVTNVIGKKTKTIEADIWLSLIPESVEKKVLGLVQKHTHISNDNILAHSFPLVSFSVIRDCFHVKESFVTMDITAETTHISFITGDIIKSTATLPIGRNYLIRQLAKNADVGQEIAESYLRLYTEYRLDAETTTLIDKTMTDIEKEWSIYFEDALVSFSAKMVISKTVFVTGEKDVNKIFSTFMLLKKEDRTKDWRSGLKLIEVNADSLSHLFVNEHPKEEDDFIAIETVFYDKRIKEL